MSRVQRIAFAVVAALTTAACGDHGATADQDEQAVQAPTVEHATSSVSLAAADAEAVALARLSNAHERLDRMRAHLADLERGSKTRAHDKLEAAKVELAEARDEFQRAFDGASETAHTRWAELEPRFDDLVGEFDARYTAALDAARTK